jgi:hypothetical protein
MRWPLHSTLVGLLGCLIFPVAYAADTVIGSVSTTRFSGGDGTLGGAVLAFEHATNDDGILMTGSRTVFPIGTLSEVDADVFKSLMCHVAVSGGASLGEASTSNLSEVLYKARFSLDSRWNSPWSLHAGYQYIDLDVVHGSLLSSTVEYRATPAGLGVKIGGGSHIGGTVADRYAQAEFNWYQRERFYGGVIIGRTGYDPANLGQTANVERLLQLYAGATIPIRGSTLSLGLDTLSLENSSRQTFRIGVIQPIRP